MNNTTGFGKELRKCGCCGKHVATRFDCQGSEIFLAHMDRGRYCPGSHNVAIASKAWIASVVAREVRS